tara:strand:- start:4165 stop:5391 length:1227 start_codon:yes stop_codon:yes gene_type:complete
MKYTETRILFFNLLSLLNASNYKGYDPYDLKAHPFFMKLIKWGKKNKINEIVREVILELTYHFPSKARSIFNIQPEHNSKALGLVGTGITEFSVLNNYDQELLSEAQSRIDELLNNYKSESLGGIGWGYPFDWESQQLIPANTPNGIVTTAVGEYYWTKFKANNDKDSLSTCVRICEFLSHLPINEIATDKICFSYIPHYQNHVHNLNLFVADFLIKVGLEVNNTEWVALGNKAVNYTITEQREDGSFDYNGPPELPQNFIDNYHTGFVLRMLGSIHHYTKREDVLIALNSGITFYLNELFTSEGIPKLKPDKIHRIDIHSAAEAINCLTFLAQYNEKNFPMATKVLTWTLNNLYDSKNHDFYYAMMKSRFTGRIYRSEVKYMRWAQAWMLRALSRYMLYSEQKKIIL